MSDHQEIHNLLSDEQYENELSNYSDSQIEYINDFNQGSYNGSIFYDTQPLVSKWVVLRDSWLTLPLQVTSSATAYSAATLLSFKNSILSLISGVIIGTSGGQSIVSDNNISIINNIRLLVEKDYDWYLEESFKLMFDKDRLTTPSSTTLGPVAPVNTSSANVGFLTRIQMLKNTAGIAGTTTWSFCVNIPLRYIHDFFDKMDFPQINNRYQFTFQLNAYSNTALNPFTTDSVVPVAQPIVTIGAASMGNGATLTSTRLYYKSVKFLPGLNEQLIHKLNSGYTKKVFFRVTDTYLPNASTTNQTTGTINITPSSASVHPLRVWLLAANTGGLSTSGSSTVVGTFTFPGQFTNCNVQINNTNYYQNALNTPAEQYEILAEQFPGHGHSNRAGSLITYQDFCAGFRMVCFDVSRLKERLKDPNSMVSVQVNATRAASDGAVACDYYIIIERLAAVTMQFSSTETKLFIGL
jgi:hypothetical protein